LELLMEWNKDIELLNLPAGSIVINIPLDNNLFDSIRSYIARIGQSPNWKKREFEKFDLAKYKPLYFCQRCNQIEDGSHRYSSAVKNGVETLDIQIFPYCYRLSRRYGHELNLAEMVNKAIVKHSPPGTSRETKWVNACEDQKWSVISKWINFRGKRHLDVGCQAGYSSFRAWFLGAKDSEGWDRREGILGIAKDVGRIIEPEQIRFKQVDWVTYKINNDDYNDSWDIVTCLGMLHYMPIDYFKNLVEKLCFICREYLVLELRMTTNPILELQPRGQEVLISQIFLAKILNYSGFEIVTQVNRPDGSRGLWIMKRR